MLQKSLQNLFDTAELSFGITAMTLHHGKHRFRAGLLAIVTAMTLTAAACGGDGYGSDGGPTGTPGGTTGSTSSNITVRNNSFDPSATTVAVGTTVNWSWAQGATDHNVTFADGQKSATQSTGSYSRTFSSAGTFSYNCTVHPGMNGSVTVR